MPDWECYNIAFITDRCLGMSGCGPAEASLASGKQLLPLILIIALL